MPAKKRPVLGRPATIRATEQLRARVPKDLARKLDKRAKREGRGRSAVIRAALDAYLGSGAKP